MMKVVDLVYLLMWCFRMFLVLCFFLGASSADISYSNRGLKGVNILGGSSPSPVTLNTQNPKQVVIQNGIVFITIAKPEGYVIGISYNEKDNLLETKNPEDNRGYLDVVWGRPELHSGGVSKFKATSFSIIVSNENIVEVSFSRTWAPTDSSFIPVNIDLRYILRKGDSGFYSYAIFNRPEGFPALNIGQLRIVYKLNSQRFHYMALANTRQRAMPSPIDRQRGQPLAYPEAVLLTNPTDPRFKGEVDDKYQYSIENEDNNVHGWITVDSAAPVGFWVITPSNEFRNCGPIKQDLTSHVGPTSLSMFMSDHYAGRHVSITFDEGETYTKVFGPIFVYLNSASNNTDFRSLWSDAVQKKNNEVGSWPYDFPLSNDFLKANKRGTVTGLLQVQDRFIKGKTLQPANNAYIGLALPGNPGSWQKESKGYQFWSRTDGNGNFIIKNVVPGKYNLYAWVPGVIGDYMNNNTITITSGCSIDLGSIVYSPPRNGPTLWEIGTPDRSAAEFYVPKAYPNLINRLYENDRTDEFRQYGLWKRYADLYPKDDLVFTVGVSDYTKDWFYAQVTRQTGEKTVNSTTWQIVFELQQVIPSGTYTLQLELASSSGAELQVRFNDPNASPPHFTTGLIGEDNAIARHGIHGLHSLFSISFGGKHLVNGKNTIYLRQSRATTLFQGVMYDYIRLEAPPSSTPTTTS